MRILSWNIVSTRIASKERANARNGRMASEHFPSIIRTWRVSFVSLVLTLKSNETRRWNTFKTCEGILDELGADIICFQGALRCPSIRR